MFKASELVSYSAWWGLLRGGRHGAAAGAATLLVGAAAAGVIDAVHGHPLGEAASWLPLACLYLPHAAAAGAVVGAAVGLVLGAVIGVLGARSTAALGERAAVAGLIAVLIAAVGLALLQGPLWGAGTLLYLAVLIWAARLHGRDVAGFAERRGHEMMSGQLAVP